MLNIECLAHRGLWTKRDQRNSISALTAALECGFGLETDLRDNRGEIVICHDLPGESETTTLDDLLSRYRDLNSTATLALNIKSDGLAKSIRGSIDRFEIEHYFLFDMSVPDMLAQMRLDLRCFARLSEWEPLLPLPPQRMTDPITGRSMGIWLDAFDDIWYSPDAINDFLETGRDVCVVSPELHGRDPQPLWEMVRAIRSDAQSRHREFAGKLMICTDTPERFLCSVATEPDQNI